MKGMRTSSQKRRASAARKALTALLLSAIMCFYGVPVAAIGESVANARTLEQAGESIQDSLTLDANGADAAAKTLKVTSGTTVSLSDYAVSRDGYTLVGWSANASADPTSAGVYKSTYEYAGVQGEQINVYHMDNEASAPEKIASNVSADPTVKAAHFSIYIVSGETTPAVATYQFLDAKGSVVSEQKVKDGETLYAPASPEKSGARFMGWTLTEGSVTADFTPGSAAVNKTETITVYPVFVGAHYVQFMDDQGRVAVTKTVGTGKTVSTADVTLPLPSTKGVTGWYSSKEAAEAQDTAKLVTECTFSSDSDPDVVLWPHIEEGHYVTFDARGGSYTKPQFVLHDKSASEPNDPAPTTPTVTYIVAAPTPAAPADDGIVTVDENGTPTAPAEHVDCWVHWLIILGTLLASLHYIGVVIRRQKNINSLRAVAGKGKNV